MEILAIIPARGGSKGIPRKNILDLNGHPLIAYSIACATQSDLVNRVICSTDSNEIADIAINYGAETPFTRPPEISNDVSTDLDVWKKSNQFVKKIYKITSKFPDAEEYGPTNQMRRCAVSIPSNIAEGAGRNSKKEFKQFLYISLGSISELETQLIISTELNYQKDNSLLDELNEIRKMLFGLIKSIKI